MVHEKALAEISSASDLNALSITRAKYLGKKGVLKDLTGQIAKLPMGEKKKLGPKLNSLKKSLEEAFSKKEQELKAVQSPEVSDFYKSLPGKSPEVGHLHVITKAIEEIVEVFKPLGFTRVRYPEIDWEYFAFESLNIPVTHPARDEWETFFVDAPKDEKYGRLTITPHTSNGQVREMLRGELPIRMLNISRCGRRQEDINHTPTFHQFEGLMVDEGVSITHLKGVLTYFAKRFFGEDREIRLRPYDFRFTEPSFEIDVTCGLCAGKSCRFCKGGWVELGGAGMVHPNVLKAGKIDSGKYTGFAFGWGVERVLMMKPGMTIDDLRYLYQNNLKFLEQF